MSNNIENNGENHEPETVLASELIQDSLQIALQDARDFKDKYLRTLADMENTKKRLAQEKEGMITYAIDSMLAEFIAPLDNLDGALSYTDNLSNEVKNWAEGFKMISAQFKEILEKHGVIPFVSVGKKFDTHYHEAIEVEETDKYEDNTVISEKSKGYLHGKRVLRVAQVKVAKKPSSSNEELKGEK